MSKRERKRVALLIDTSTGWGRNIIRGVSRYERECGDWDLTLQPYAQVDYIPLPARWSGDGIIARVAGQKMAEELLRTGLPVVNVSSLELSSAAVFPRVIADFPAAGRMAADHLTDRGFCHFAYCAPAGAPSSSGFLHEGYSSRLNENGFGCRFLEIPDQRVSPEQRQDLVLEWLLKQERPLAVFAWSIDAPHEVIEACYTGNICIPEEIAVISSASMDELILQVMNPSVSCVVTPESSIGYSAAEMLSRMMAGGRRKKKSETVLISPSHVEVRESSDVMKVSDPALVKALRFMRDYAVQGIRVDEVARQAGLSRRGLEQKMQTVLHRSPAEELRQIRLNHARELLRTTMLSIPDVAERSGFGTVEHFITFFRKSSGMTPLQYAKKNRAT